MPEVLIYKIGQFVSPPYKSYAEIQSYVDTEYIDEKMMYEIGQYGLMTLEY